MSFASRKNKEDSIALLKSIAHILIMSSCHEELCADSQYLVKKSIKKIAFKNKIVV